MNDEIEHLKRQLDSSKESHRTDLFLIYWIIGEILLGLLTGFDNWIFFIGSWVVVWLSWKLSTVSVKK